MVLNYLIKNLFELKINNKNSKLIANIEDETYHSELESYVVNAINRRDLIVMTQDVFENGTAAIKECFIKLKTDSGKILHQKLYMKILDKFGLMIDYDLMVLEKIVSRCKDSNKEVFAISISPTSIRNTLFFSNVI